MRPDEYEKVVARQFEDWEYEVNLTPYSNDYGVDLFASKGVGCPTFQVGFLCPADIYICRQRRQESR